MNELFKKDKKSFGCRSLAIKSTSALQIKCCEEEVVWEDREGLVGDAAGSPDLHCLLRYRGLLPWQQSQPPRRVYPTPAESAQNWSEGRLRPAQGSRPSPPAPAAPLTLKDILCVSPSPRHRQSLRLSGSLHARPPPAAEGPPRALPGTDRAAPGARKGSRASARTRPCPALTSLTPRRHTSTTPNFACTLSSPHSHHAPQTTSTLTVLHTPHSGRPPC